MSVRPTVPPRLAVVRDDSRASKDAARACSNGRRPLGWLFHDGPGGRLDPDSPGPDHESP